MAEAARHAFFSYSNVDKDFVLGLSEQLALQGTEVWVDVQQLSSGQVFPNEIEAAITTARAFVFVISPDSVISQNCGHELELALDAGKRIVPILYRPVSADSIPSALRTRQWIDFSDPNRFDTSFFQLQTALAEEDRPAAGGPMGQTASAGRVIVRLVSEESPVPEELPATPALARLLARAQRINSFYEQNFDLTFSSMLLAFLTSNDPISQWFQRYEKDAGITMDALLQRRSVDRTLLAQIEGQPVAVTEQETPLRQTFSAKALFASVHEFVRRALPQGGNARVADVRDLMAAYIYRPAGHERDLAGLGFKAPAWSNAFLGQIALRYPAELEYWKDWHRDAFPTDPPVIPETDGLSAHIATDIWTLNDSLGYRAYAYAISQFMTHRLTSAPLTVSIQAPWGGGKTSLMRMIQRDLDPDAFEEVKEEAQQPRGELTVGKALAEIEDWIRSNTHKPLPAVEDAHSKRLTVWFNAWKYESTNQVWAGLVDAIVQQVAARLPVVQRERFWLLLNLKRMDADKIRHQIYERVFNYWWRGVRVWVWGLGATMLVSAIVALLGSLTGQALGLMAGWGGLFTSAASGGYLGFQKFRKARKDVDNEPAAVSLREYLEIPDYGKELGFIHHVEADLRRVLGSVPHKYRPIVIFIDDLDRCSPTKVAQVVEAVNLFLAGDFPNCMFVLGIDAEMVAAALQAAHKDMIAGLPADAGIPVGWRFMDKFVQLPFIIPPAEDGNVSHYTTTLFSVDQRMSADREADRVAQEAAERISTRSAIDSETERLRREHKFNERQVARIRDQIEARMVQRQVDAGIARFTDENPEIQRVINAATCYFRGNPRDLKRFINAFRFNYFLWLARLAQGLECPNLQQLLRWTVFSMKWPEVVRWLRRSGGTEWQVIADGNGGALPTRLKLIEEISEKATDLATWQDQAKAVLRLKAETTPWLNDDDLLEFLHKEGRSELEGQRMSDGAGKGFW